MPFLAVTFELEARDPAVVEEACLALGAFAVTFSDERDDPVLEPAPGEVRLWPATRVQALFGEDAAAAHIVGSLSAALAIDTARITCRELEDRPWEREWLKDFHARRFGRRLWVCPGHEQVDEPGACVVRLDPGLAFGTGSHVTTAMCLEWLDAHLSPGALVVDYGCGSGVLGVAAAKLGAREVWCYDLDPQALIATRENAEANAVSGCVRVVDAAERLPAGADVLLANILAGTLCELAPRLARLVAHEGTAVLSGILADEAGEVTRAYGAWFDTRTFATREDWVCLAARRTARD